MVTPGTNCSRTSDVKGAIKRATKTCTTCFAAKQVEYSNVVHFTTQKSNLSCNKGCCMRRKVVGESKVSSFLFAPKSVPVARFTGPTQTCESRLTLSIQKSVFVQLATN